MTYEIHEDNMPRLEKKLTRICNKCRKYGCEFRFEKTGEIYRDVFVCDENGRIIIGLDGEPVIVKARFVIVEVEGIAKLNDWRFIATLEHTQSGNIINKCPDAKEIEVPKRYYNINPVCEHCNSKRARKNTYIVMNTKTGEFKQVGKSCLADFTGGLSAEAVARYLSMFEELLECESIQEGHHYKMYIETEDFLRCVAETIRCFGYTRSVEDRSTRERAYQYYAFHKGFLASIYHDIVIEELSQTDFDFNSKTSAEYAHNALEWIRGLDESELSGNYMHNLSTVCNLEYISSSHYGILVSLFPTFDKELVKQAEQAEREKKAKKESENSEYVGEIKQRIKITVSAARCLTSWESEFGTVRLWKIVDEKGNIFIWKTSKMLPDVIKEIVGTVKDHKMFRGVKQTELTRCRI